MKKKFGDWNEEWKSERNKKEETLERERVWKLLKVREKIKGEREGADREFTGRASGKWKFGAKISLNWEATALIPALWFLSYGITVLAFDIFLLFNEIMVMMFGGREKTGSVRRRFCSCNMFLTLVNVYLCGVGHLI